MTAAWLALALLPCGDEDWFTDVTERALPAVTIQCGAIEKDWILAVNGGGVGLADLDGDGHLDLVAAQLGLGNYWRVAHEFLLLGVRGGAIFRDRSKRSWFEASRGSHSEKPVEVRAMLEAVSPGPYLELFARGRAAGWTVWGNQIS